MFNLTHWFKTVMTVLLVTIPCVASAKNQNLYIYNWFTYIAPDTLENFQKQTGIKVHYDVFDSNDVLDSKLMAGKTGFDLVVPSASFLERQIKTGIFEKLDKSKLPNYKNLDENILKIIPGYDPNKIYGIPYMWSTTGIAYNMDKIRERLGDDAPTDSWNLILDPENLKKLSSCGVAFLDAPTDVFPIILNYLGKDPNSQDPQDQQMALDYMMKLRPYITYFHSSKLTNDLANGDICIALSWAGESMQAIGAAEEANNKVKINYIIPKEGTIAEFDMFAIPKDAKNKDAAYQFLNYLLEPKVIADISNTVYYANPNKYSTPYLDDQIRLNPALYPPQQVMDKLFSLRAMPPKMDRLRTRHWTFVLSGK